MQLLTHQKTVLFLFLVTIQESFIAWKSPNQNKFCDDENYNQVSMIQCKCNRSLLLLKRIILTPNIFCILLFHNTSNIPGALPCLNLPPTCRFPIPSTLMEYQLKEKSKIRNHNAAAVRCCLNREA